MTADGPTGTTPYGSCRDLPSFLEMSAQVSALKVFTLFIARDQRSKVKALKRDLDRLCDVVDRFYKVLGPRNWIFHDQLNLDDVEALLNSNVEEAEEGFVELYRDEETLDRLIRRLRGLEGFRAREHLIERARDNYRRNHFDSCALLLVSVADGFVNDFEQDVRKGLHTREPDSMVAWDSVVGHHMGLTHVLKSFGKPIKKRIDEEVFELYRHGMAHGMVVHYDNATVATKAWNLIFAVADWATATTRSRQPQPEEPTWSQVISKLQKNRKDKELIAQWSPTTFTADDPAFGDHVITVKTQQFLHAWTNRNYGSLATFENRMYVTDKADSRIAGEMRERFESWTLEDFEILGLDNSALAVWVSRGTAEVNGEAGSFECRWVRQREDGFAAIGEEPGDWRLTDCSPTVWKPDGL